MSMTPTAPKERKIDWTLTAILAFSAFFGIMMTIGMLHTVDFLALHIKALLGARAAS